MKKRMSIKLLSLTLAISSVISIGLFTAKPTVLADDETESVVTVDDLSPAQKVIKIARAEVGYHEKNNTKNLNSRNKKYNGKKNYTKYAKYFDSKRKSYKFYNGKKQGVAWCDVFVDWCFAQAFGIDVASEILYQKKNSCGAAPRYSKKYYKDNGAYDKKPQEGDQIFFKKKNKITHTGIVVSVNKKDKKVTVIEGNSGNKVAKHTYSMSNSKIAGYGHPNYPTDTMKSFVTNLYSGAINSTLATKTLNLYSCKLANGRMTGAYLVKAVFESKRMKELNLTNEEYINKIPSVLFGRTATEKELSHWLNALETGAATRHDVLKAFVNTAEFKKLCTKTGIKKEGKIT